MAFEVTTHSRLIEKRLTVDTAAYAVGDCMGGKITLANAARATSGTSILTDIVIIDESNVKPLFNIVIFGVDPTAATLTDNAAVNLSTNSKDVIAVVPVYTADYNVVAGVSIATIQVGNIVLQTSPMAESNTTFYAALVATYANDMVASDDLIIKFGLVQD